MSSSKNIDYNNYKYEDLVREVIQMKNKMEKMEKELLKIKRSSSEDKSNENIITIRDIKKEDFLELGDATKDYVLKQLEMNSVKTDFNFIKTIYFKDKNYKEYPIRFVNRNTFEYWSDNKWHMDRNGEDKVINILIYNIRASYLKSNQFENYPLDKSDIFIENQTHIHNMEKDKYKTSIRNLLKKHLKNKMEGI